MSRDNGQVILQACPAETINYFQDVQECTEKEKKNKQNTTRIQSFDQINVIYSEFLKKKKSYKSKEFKKQRKM